MPRKRRSGYQTNIEFLNTALSCNMKAMEEGPKRKNWSMHDLKIVQPLTPNQDEFFHSWYNGANICAHGSAGTGKTFLAFYLALQEVLNKQQSKIILVRSAVQTRDLGFMPGTLEEKLMNFELPYKEILWELVGRPTTYDDMKERGLIEFHSTSFMKGITWDNAIVIVDEVENMTFKEIHGIMTRLGQNTRIILAGDTSQTDLDGSRKLGSEGITNAMRVFENMESFDRIEFNVHDIVRGDLVKSWIMACEEVA